MIYKAYPPNIKKIQKVIPQAAMQHACFTYGDDIYNPGGGAIDEPIGLHEAHHSLQQAAVGGPEKWWRTWLTDPRFRVAQELEGYGIQFRRYCELTPDRNRRARELHRLATDLSSPQYGGVIGYIEARTRIRDYYTP